MPLYDYECTCGEIGEFITRIGDMQKCPHCGAEMKRVISAVNINIGVHAAGYYDETLESYVTSNRHRRELCRERGVTPYGDTPKPNGEAWV
jgi:putative FmdB family regulatory protein